MNTAPIGIFDSGIGGLTIVKAIQQLLPQENLIYYGDTKHTPWGDKATTTIKSYAVEICEILSAKGCKAIVIACNTASAVAYQEIINFAPNIPIINVIDPVVNYVAHNFKEKIIGLIGTKQTIASKSYLAKITAKTTTITLKALATPLLVPLIEEGLTNSLPTKLILNMYLANEQLQDIQALILGCTHYPLLKIQIAEFYNQQIPIIDATTLTAISVQQILTNQQLLNPGLTPASKTFYISDHNPHFIKLAKLFGEPEIILHPIAK